jgi:hypothetical protein
MVLNPWSLVSDHAASLPGIGNPPKSRSWKFLETKLRIWQTASKIVYLCPHFNFSLSTSK